MNRGEQIAKQMVKPGGPFKRWALFDHDGNPPPDGWCFVEFQNEQQALQARAVIAAAINAELTSGTRVVAEGEHTLPQATPEPPPQMHRAMRALCDARDRMMAALAWERQARQHQQRVADLVMGMVRAPVMGRELQWATEVPRVPQ